MTTANLRIVAKNDADDATLTASSELADFAAENVQNTVRSKVWRSSSNAGQTITGVFPTNRTVSHASLHKHLCHAGNWRFQLFSDAGASVQVYDSTAISATSYAATEPYVWSEGSNDPFLTDSSSWLWFAETAARSFKLTLSGTPAQAYWQIGRLWVGRYLEVAINPSYGLMLGRQDNADASRTRGGSLRTNQGASWRNLQCDLEGIDEDEHATWQDIMQRAGRGRDMVVSGFPGDGTRKEALHCFAGKLVALNAIGRQVNRLTMRMQFEEN